MERRVFTNLIGVKKSVTEALKLDDGQQPNDAYIKYLECMQTIISSLLHDANTQGDITKHTNNFIKLGLQCMERIALIVDSLPKANFTHASTRPAPLSLPPSDILASIDRSGYMDHGYTSLPSVPSRQHHVPPATPTSLVLQSPTELRSLQPSNIPSLMTSPTNVNTNMFKSHVDTNPCPVEIAQRQNQKLLAAYQARIARTGPAKQQQLATLNLSLQRRLAENLAVAKAREQTLTRKLQERHQRLQQDAVRRFNDATTMSKEELERHHLYTEILDYEKSRNNLVVWRQRLDNAPEDDTIILTLVKTLFSLPDHPLTQLLYKYQQTIYLKLGPLVEKYSSKPPILTAKSKSNNESSGQPCTSSQSNQSSPNSAAESEEDNPTTEISENDSSEKNIATPKLDDAKIKSEEIPTTSTSSESFTCLSPLEKDYEAVSTEEVTRLEVEALQRHLQNIVADVHLFLEQLLAMFVVAYKPLGTDSGRDSCYAAIEEPFFKPIWGYLLALYRIVDKLDEERACTVMNKYKDCLPSTLKIPSRYCLEDEGIPTAHAFPYEPAVRELASLGHYKSPLSQLECIVRVSRLICNCVEEYYQKLGQAESTGLGADDLLPLLSFVIARSGRPLLVAECRVLEEFIHEGYLIGEEGYCLTSLQTALGYILTLTDRSPT